MPPSPAILSRRAARLILGAALAFGLGSVLYAAWQQDWTYDEPYHLRWSERLLDRGITERETNSLWNSKTPITVLSLSEPLACPKAAHAAEAATKKKKRQLWGSGKGKFRSKGKNASATVRGTIWLTQDTCTTTLVHVKRGIVDVFDFVKHKHVLVKAGHTYVARSR